MLSRIKTISWNNLKIKTDYEIKRNVIQYLISCKSVNIIFLVELLKYTLNIFFGCWILILYKMIVWKKNECLNQK